MASSKGSGRKSTGKKATSAAAAVVVPAGPPPKWVVIQLTSLGEKEKSIDIITRSIRRLLGDVEVFVPAIAQKGPASKESQTTFYMDGYVFVRHREDVNYMKLQETMYFKSVLCSPGSNGKKTYCLLDDFVLTPMRDGVQSMKTQGVFSTGMDVKIIQGSLKGLKGKVNLVYESGEKVQVFVPLTSKPVLIEFPPNYLEKIDV